MTNDGTTGTLLFTSNAGPATVVGNAISSATTFVQGFLGNANGVVSGTANSVLLSPTTTWGQSAYEGSVDANLGIQFTQAGSGVDAVVGANDTLLFYDESSNKLNSASKPSTLSTIAGTWTYAAGVATYTASGIAAVPLPTPILLLLSGLGLMGVVARRNKNEAFA